MLLYVSVRTLFLFGLSYVYVSFRLHEFPVMFSHDFLDICSCFTFHHFPMFPSCALCFILSLSQTPQLPSTLVYCTLLISLRSHSRIPLRRICSLVYISPVLIATNLRTNITCSHSYLSEVLWNARKLQLGSGCLVSPLF